MLLYIFADPTCVLLPPHCGSESLSTSLANRIAIALSTRFNKPLATIKKYFNASDVQQWAKVQRLEGGDRMLALSMLTSLEDPRDATFVRVSRLYQYNSKSLLMRSISMFSWSMPMPETSDLLSALSLSLFMGSICLKSCIDPG
jgi:hypothetical protein